MMSLNGLVASTLELISGVRGRGFLRTGTFQITKVAAIQSDAKVIVQAKFQAKTDKKATQYRTTLVFHDMHFTENKPKALGKMGNNFWNTLTVEIAKGKVAYVGHPSKTKNPCQVSCTCRDYYYTFWYYDKTIQAHDGKDRFPPGFKNIDPKGIRNPVNKPGICKHIYELQYHLSLKGFLVKN